MKGFIAIQNLRGERGLLIAILTQAYKDATSQSRSSVAAAYRHEARRWFGSDDCKAVVTALGLPPHLMPLDLEPMAAGGD